MTYVLVRTLAVPLLLTFGPSAALATEVAETTRNTQDPSVSAELTAAQEKSVLRLLNNICGDTWCDGDWEFTFEKLTCNLTAGTCTWTALIQPSVPVASPVPVYWRSCKVSGLHTFSDLVDTAPSGYQSLTSTYYDASTSCVQGIEPKLPPYTPLP